MTIGDCAGAGPATANAATNAAAKISLRMFPPVDFWSAPAAQLPISCASGTNTEKPTEMPLPVSRGRRKALLHRKKRGAERRIFAFRIGGIRPSVFLKQSARGHRWMSGWLLLAVLVSAPEIA